MEKLFEIKNSVQKIFTKSLLKKFLAVAIIGAICAGGGGYYFHQQKVAEKIAENQARTNLVQNLAKEKNLVIIDSDAVKNLTAKTIGIDADKITYKEISLREHDKDHKDIFQPIYKVSCRANDVKYKLRIDAVSGAVLDIDVG